MIGFSLMDRRGLLMAKTNKNKKLNNVSKNKTIVFIVQHFLGLKIFFQKQFSPRQYQLPGAE